MPMPPELEGKALLGSIWVRRLGKHRGFKWKMTGFNDAGVKLEPDDNQKGWRTHIGDKRVTSMQWPMFMNLYELEGKLSMLVTVDKEGYVQKVEPEKNGTLLISKAAAKEVVQDAIAVHMCMGPWHRKGGKGTELPVDQFSIATRGKNIGELASYCNSCRDRNAEWNRLRAVKEGRVKLVAPVKPAPPEVPKPVVPATEPVKTVPEELWVEPTVHTPNPSGLKRWKVTYIPSPEPVTVEVEAKDWFEAGTMVGSVEVKAVVEA